MADETVRKTHWNDVYQNKAPDRVSWYQPRLHQSLSLIDGLSLPEDAHIIDVGSGASTLMDDLLNRGFSNLTALDLAGSALEVAQKRLGPRAQSVTWIEGDVTQVTQPQHRYDLWHDRAVFHFLTDDDARARYLDRLRYSLKPGGHALIASFGLQGPKQCSGLDVIRYSSASMAAKLGSQFRLVSETHESHQTPWESEQEFVYCLFQRAG